MVDLPRALLHLRGRISANVTLDPLLAQILRSVLLWQVPKRRVLVAARRVGQRRESAEATGDDQALRADVPEVDGEAGLPRREPGHHHGETSASV